MITVKTSTIHGDKDFPLEREFKNLQDLKDWWKAHPKVWFYDDKFWHKPHTDLAFETCIKILTK